MLEIDVEQVYASCSLSEKSPPDGLIKARYIRTIEWAHGDIIYTAILNARQKIFIIVSIGGKGRSNFVVSLCLDWSKKPVITFDTGIVSRPFRCVLPV